jgi:ribosomal protein L21
VALRTAELRSERASLERISVASLEALVNALEAKEPYLRGDSARVADFAAMVAAELGMGDEQVEAIRTGGRLHDIGKIGIREEILNKHGPLTDEEFEHVKAHPVTGSDILAPLTHLGPVIGFVRSHHEQWGGRGYPERLVGEEIPFGARVVSIAGVFDALTSPRSIRPAYGKQEAVDIMQKDFETMFAVIKTGGKQYRVSKDDVIAIEKLDGDSGATIVFDEVLMLGDQVGAPRVANAQVTAEVVRQFRDDKVIIFKKRRRKHYRRRNGHRQHLTLVKITDMGAVSSRGA